MNLPSDPDTGVCLAGGLARHGGQGLSSDGGSGKPGREDNIGSIITMLITDQSVDLDDYLGDPLLSNNGDKILLAASIKQEETLAEAVSPSSTMDSPVSPYSGHQVTPVCSIISVSVQ